MYAAAAPAATAIAPHPVDTSAARHAAAVPSAAIVFATSTAVAEVTPATLTPTHAPAASSSAVFHPPKTPAILFAHSHAVRIAVDSVLTADCSPCTSRSLLSPRPSHLLNASTIFDTVGSRTIPSSACRSDTSA